MTESARHRSAREVQLRQTHLARVRAPRLAWRRSRVVLLLGFALGAAVWGAWLGWDTEYYWDAGIGAYQGPYRESQVIGCAVTYGLVAALLSLRWHPVAVALGMAGGFAAGWIVQAAVKDDSGLFLVGAILLVPGLLVGGLIAGGCGVAARRLLRRGPGDRRSGDGLEAHPSR